MKKIAVLAHRLDGLFMKEQCKEAALYFLVPHDHLWLRSNIPASHCIPFTLTKKISIDDISDDDIIRNSTITQELKRKKITAFVTSHRGSYILKRWAAENSIELIGTNPDHQVYYENKLHFDHLLSKLRLPRPESTIVKGGEKPFSFPFVLQEPSSFGSFGTYRVFNQKSWDDLRQKLSPEKKYLARRFIEGESFGITVYIDNFRIALSAIRQQCFYQGTTTFAGIQWRKTSSFRKKTIAHLNQTFLHLGLSLQEKGFFGFANIDFILDPLGRALLLECNPRLSSASPHLFGVPELFGSIPITDLFLTKGEIANPPPFFFFEIPDSSFEGSVFDIVHTSPEPRSVPEHSSGIYRFTPTIQLVSSRFPALLSKKESFLFYAHTLPHSSLKYDTQFGTVISDFPLFTTHGTSNRKGLALLSYFSNE